MARVVDSGRVSPEEIEAKVDEVARKMEILRVRYEQYFIGVEKVPPVTMRMDVARIIRELEQTNIKNTAIKFKMRTQIQKFTSYSTYWNRTLREIEDGTYRRHKDKMRRMAATATEAADKPGEVVAQEPQVENQAKVQAVADEAEDFLASLGLVSRSSRPAEMDGGRVSASGRSAEIAAAQAGLPNQESPQAVVRKPAIVGASKPAIVIARPAAAPPAASSDEPSPAIIRTPVVRPAAKPAIVHPASKPAIVAAKPAVVQPAAPSVVRPVVVRPAAAKPAIVQPAAPPVVRPAIVRSAANPAIVQPASQESATGAPKPPTFPPLKKS